jgi:hypothetical protein
VKRSTETDLVNACLQRLALIPGVFAWRNNNAGIRRRTQQGREFWQAPAMKGVSDILGWVSIRWVTLQGEARAVARFLAIETKQPGRKPTPEQKVFLERVREGGGIGIVAYSIEDLEAGLRAAGVIL